MKISEMICKGYLIDIISDEVNLRVVVSEVVGGVKIVRGSRSLNILTITSQSRSLGLCSIETLLDLIYYDITENH